MEQKQIIKSILFSLFFVIILALYTKAQNPQDSIQKSDSLVIIRKNITIENVDFINIDLRTYTDIVASPLFTFNNYPDNTPVDNNYKQTHHNNVSMQLGITQGLIFNKWYISLSVLYKRFSEQFISCDAKGPKDTTYEKYSNYTILKIKTRGYNEELNYQYLNFPLIIGHLSSFQRYIFSFHAGLDMNFLLRAKGMMVLNQDIQNISQEQYHKFQLGLIAGLSAGYKINNNFLIFLEPQFVYALTPVLYKETGVNCKTSLLSVLVGIRKYF